MAKAPIQYFRQEDFPELAKEAWAPKLFSKLNQMARQTTYGLDGKLSVTENLSGFWWKGNVGFYSKTSSEFACGALDTDGKVLVLIPPATSPGTNIPKYTRDSNGIVYLTGKISSALNVVVANLPLGYRPSETNHYSIASDSGAGKAAIAEIATNGDLIFTDPGPQIFSLDGLSFFAVKENTLHSPVNTSIKNTKAFPFTILNEMMPVGVAAILVAQAFDVTNGSTQAIPSALGPVAWAVRQNAVDIFSIGGMVPGRCYSVKLLVLGE